MKIHDDDPTLFLPVFALLGTDLATNASDLAFLSIAGQFTAHLVLALATEKLAPCIVQGYPSNRMIWRAMYGHGCLFEVFPLHVTRIWESLLYMG
jgi:hypothetical protein